MGPKICPCTATRRRCDARPWKRVLLAACLAILLCRLDPAAGLRIYRGLPPDIPEAAQPGESRPVYVNIPAINVAPLYRSPIDGGLVAEWPGGTQVLTLGSRFDDGRAQWDLVRDPAGNEGWVGSLFLDGRLSVVDPLTEADDDYLSSVSWTGEIVVCANPAGGPPGLDGDAFVALVERAIAKWQEVAEGTLPLTSRGRCEYDPTQRGDGINVIGWVDDLGLVIAGQAWPDADHGTLGEFDIWVSRGYFERRLAHNPTRSMRACVFSTVVHELGHLLGLDHPRSRALPSSMQAVGASRCDKGQPSVTDKANLLRRYGPSASFP
jgi:hypothetical protein